MTNQKMPKLCLFRRVRVTLFRLGAISPQSIDMPIILKKRGENNIPRFLNELIFCDFRRPDKPTNGTNYADNHIKIQIRVPEELWLCPKFFGMRKRRTASDEFYRDEIRASKAGVDEAPLQKFMIY